MSWLVSSRRAFKEDDGVEVSSASRDLFHGPARPALPYLPRASFRGHGWTRAEAEGGEHAWPCVILLRCARDTWASREPDSATPWLRLIGREPLVGMESTIFPFSIVDGVGVGPAGNLRLRGHETSSRSKTKYVRPGPPHHPPLVACGSENWLAAHQPPLMN